MYTDREICLELLNSADGPKKVKERFVRNNGHSPEMVNLDTYLQDNIDSIKRNYWNSLWSRYNRRGGFRAINVALNKGYHKMIITKYFTTSLDQIPKGSTAFFIGKRHTKVKVIKETLEFYGLEWERKDWKKADFFIVGNDLSSEEIKYNADLSKPMVMDDELRVDSHFSVYNKATITQLDNSRLTNLFAKSTYDNLKLICNLIQHVSRDALTNVTKFRLLRLYVDIFYFDWSSNAVNFDIRNKEHVFLSDTVQKFCIPHLRFYVTSSFLKNTPGRFRVNQDRTKGFFGEVVIDLVDKNSEPYYFIPHFGGSLEVYKKDMEDGNSHSIIQVPNFNSLNDFARFSVDRVWDNNNYTEWIINIGNNFSHANFKFRVVVDKESRTMKFYHMENSKNYTTSNTGIVTDYKEIDDDELRNKLQARKREEFTRYQEMSKKFLEDIVFPSDINLTDTQSSRAFIVKQPKFKEFIAETDNIYLGLLQTSKDELTMKTLKSEKRIHNLKYLNL